MGKRLSGQVEHSALEELQEGQQVRSVASKGNLVQHKTKSGKHEALQITLKEDFKVF